MYKVIATGSSGNAILYFNSVLVDIGVSYKKLTPYLKKIQLVLLTHEHTDHMNIKTLKTLQYNKPTVIIACGSFMLPKLKGVSNVYVLDYGKWYDFGNVRVSPVHLYHDVENFGYRIIYNNKKILHATDTSTLEGISAKGYSLYAIEHNYSENTLKTILETSEEFEHGWRSRDTHLSVEQAEQFIRENASKDSIIVKLHQSSRYGENYEISSRE